MCFVVAEECVALGLRAGVIVFHNLQVTAGSAELRSTIKREVEAVRARWPDPAAIRAIPEVIRYQEILRRVGVNPRKEQPSVERLLSLAFKKGDLPAINNLVDAYNLVSIRSLCSLGAHDLATIDPPVSLRFFTGRETFTPLGSAKEETVVPGEFGYVDAQDRVLCRLDVRQADGSKVTTATQEAMLIIEGTDAHAPEAIRQAYADVIELVTRYCGGTAEIIG